MVAYTPVEMKPGHTHISIVCVAVCCGVLRCVSECCGVLQCVAMCCGVLRCVAVCCGYTCSNGIKTHIWMSHVILQGGVET